MNYSDIDLSLLQNTKGDISIINGISNCVRNCMINNLLVSAKEVPFDNSFRPNLYDVIHSDAAITYEMQIRDTIKYVALRDERIKSIDSINIKTVNDYELSIEVKLLLQNQSDLTTFVFKVERN